MLTAAPSAASAVAIARPSPRVEASTRARRPVSPRSIVAPPSPSRTSHSSDRTLAAGRIALHAARIGSRAQVACPAVILLRAGGQPALGPVLAHGDRMAQRLQRLHRRRRKRSEEHTSELQSLMRTSYAVFCLKKKTNI